jgi:hypothetical protein
MVREEFVRTKGLEPLQELPRQNLNLVRLPFRHVRAWVTAARILLSSRYVKAGSRASGPRTQVDEVATSHTTIEEARALLAGGAGGLTQP